MEDPVERESERSPSTLLGFLDGGDFRETTQPIISWVDIGEYFEDLESCLVGGEWLSHPPKRRSNDPTQLITLATSTAALLLLFLAGQPACYKEPPMQSDMNFIDLAWRVETYEWNHWLAHLPTKDQQLIILRTVFVFKNWFSIRLSQIWMQYPAGVACVHTHVSKTGLSPKPQAGQLVS